ncbi:MAG: hypothetical protein CMP92_00360 [Gammaproteobacteria bacterium]|nr:hypothetical protein [Gammaproteobacteria bacterium]|tara:strand:+ start:4638 stop:4832 length:195 start_codon:yes stop_codon:yes gene_type:complete
MLSKKFVMELKKKQQLIYLNKSVASQLKIMSKRYDLSISKLAEIILRDGVEQLKKNGIGKLKID